MAIGCGCRTGLYDNKLVADYINRVGQRLVAADSERLFAFRLDGTTRYRSHETLSTGTIYISTGLVSLLDNEAQLAYVLAHEMAHVQLDHWKLKSTLLAGAGGVRRRRKAGGARCGRAVIGAAAGATVGRAWPAARRLGGSGGSGAAALVGARIGAGVEQRPQPRLGHACRKARRTTSPSR